MGVGRYRRDPGNAQVEGRNVLATGPAEGEDEPAEAAVDVEANLVLEGQLAELGDGVHGAVAVVAGRSNEGNSVTRNGTGHEVEIDLRRHWVDGSFDHLDAEEMTGLGEGGVGSLGLDDVRTPRALGVRLSVGEHGVGDRPRPTRGHEATGGRDAAAAEQVQGHGDDLGFELRGARAHVALEDVDVAELGEGFVEEVVVVVVAAVHGA